MSVITKINFPSISQFACEFYYSTNTNSFDARIWPPHIHNTLEFYVLIEGNVSFMVEHNLYELTPGDIIISKPNEIHNCILKTKSLHKHLCFWFDTSCEFLLSSFLNHNFGENNLICPSNEDKEKLLNIYSSLDNYCKLNDKKGQFFTIVEILHLLEKNVPKSSTCSSIPAQLQIILQDVNENFSGINSLEYLCEKHFISQSTLGRLFRRHLHTSPKMYLESKKLAFSRVLLKEGKSVFQACILSGFSDCSNYIRLFKKRFGITPKQYQNN